MYIMRAPDVGEKMVCGFVLGDGVHRLGTFAEGVHHPRDTKTMSTTTTTIRSSDSQKFTLLSTSMHISVISYVLFQ